MRLHPSLSRWLSSIAVGAAVAVGFGFAPVEQAQKSEVGQNKKPSIRVKANPPVGFSPLRVIVTAELIGGSDDYADFYCASIEWDWGDDTKSETKADCDPYEPGKSEIKRRYVMEHTFRSFGATSMPGSFDSGQQGPMTARVKFNLKQKNKVVGSGQTTVEIRAGLGGGM